VIYIWVRKTVDWADEQAYWAQAPTDMKPKAELWNATFTLPFHLFRHRVREIAELNLGRVDRAVVADWDAIPDGALVLPVDDDDWFAPDIVRVLERELDPAVDGCYWPSRWIEVPTRFGHRVYLLRRKVLPFTPPKWILTTNNYAMIKSEDAKILLRSHTKASRWLKSGAGRMTRIEESLSLTNRTLGSWTTLRFDLPSIGRAELIGKFRRYQRLYGRPPRGLDWAEPYVRMMGELMADVELR
jgi:hypothetical protein